MIRIRMVGRRRAPGHHSVMVSGQLHRSSRDNPSLTISFPLVYQPWLSVRDPAHGSDLKMTRIISNWLIRAFIPTHPLRPSPSVRTAPRRPTEMSPLLGRRLWTLFPRLHRQAQS